jgi:hypothetical protein
VELIEEFAWSGHPGNLVPRRHSIN